MGEKSRLDVLLLEKGLFETREKARKSIMTGIVFVNHERIDKPGTQVPSNAIIELKGSLNPYVSRGGLKLEKAISEFDLKLMNKTAMDIGASTGGFTDCMLKNGVKKVFAIDVGYGQLAWTLRQDDRVVVMERTNIRYVTHEDIDCEIDFVSIDVSFISLTMVLPVVKKLLRTNGEVVCLIKPQFEVGREKVGKKGVVRDEKAHREVIDKILNFSTQIGFEVIGLSYSPIKGPEGNIEYLAYLNNTETTNNTKNLDDLIDLVICSSHKELESKK